MAQYPKIFSTLKERIENQVYTDVLPPLKELAREFKVNINTVQRAIGELKKINLVYSINGVGIFVNSNLPDKYRRIVTVYVRNFVNFNNHTLYTFIGNLQRELAAYDIGMDISLHDALPNPATCQAVLIHTSSMTDSKIAELKNHIMPEKIYYFDRFSQDIQMIGVDNFSGGYDAVSYLYRRGHRHIGIIAYSQVPEISFYERVKGAEKAAAELKNVKLRIFDLGDTTAASDENIQQKCFREIVDSEEKLDAVFCLTDRLAIQFMVYCREHGVRVPDDISVLGYDNNSFTKFFSPALTTFEEPYGELAGMTARRLASPIRHTGEPLQLLCKPILIERNSVKDINQTQQQEYCK